MKPCQVNLAMKALHAHGFDSTNIHQFLSGLTWPSQFATEAKAATVAFKGKPAGFTASASQCLSLYVPLRYYISTLGVNNSAAYVSFISLVELLELLALNAEGDRCGGAVSVVFPAGFFHSRIARVHVLVQI